MMMAAFLSSSSWGFGGFFFLAQEGRPTIEMRLVALRSSGEASRVVARLGSVSVWSPAFQLFSRPRSHTRADKEESKPCHHHVPVVADPRGVIDDGPPAHTDDDGDASGELQPTTNQRAERHALSLGDRRSPEATRRGPRCLPPSRECEGTGSSGSCGRERSCSAESGARPARG
jgi:hypothetical protein